MSLATDFIAYYQSVVDGRMWWNTIPKGNSAQSLATPFILLQHMGGPRRQYVEDTQPEFLQARVQVEVWGARVLAVDAAMRAFIGEVIASNSADWYARISGEPIGDHNEALDLHGSRVDVMLAYRNPDYDEGEPETNYLLADNGDILTAENGDRLTWR